jgi:hypothetical protein
MTAKVILKSLILVVILPTLTFSATVNSEAELEALISTYKNAYSSEALDSVSIYSQVVVKDEALKPTANIDTKQPSQSVQESTPEAYSSSPRTAPDKNNLQQQLANKVKQLKSWGAEEAYQSVSGLNTKNCPV